MNDIDYTLNQILKIKEEIIEIIKTQNQIMKCVIQCQEQIKKLEQKNG
tara:strand:+ start:10586 stop:10729 length:144 start_codon:yes stop_codon:yes gene_type:complete